MREILFRGKRIDNGEWVYGYYVKDPKNNHRIYWKPFSDASRNTYHFVIPESVGQFTGCCINNDKIFDGSLITNTSRNNNSPHVVRWSVVKGAWVGAYGIEYLISEELNEINVVGNITDNPELVKQ